MAHKLATQAEHHWQKINGINKKANTLEGARFIDGITEKPA